MTVPWRLVRRRLFGLAADSTCFTRRGFRGANKEAREHLERVGAAFVSGYHLGLEAPSLAALLESVEKSELEMQGFAIEGAAMALTLLDVFTPWKSSRLQGLMNSAAGIRHTYMIHVGVGWIWARMPIPLRPAMALLDPVHQWLAYDGWGFHDGYFYGSKLLESHRRPRSVKGYAARAYDQGVGRSLWFSQGANASLVASVISTFDTDRRSDLWSGIGLAATYAGGVDAGSLSELRWRAAEFQPVLSQGSVFAAKARQRAGNPTQWTDLATRALAQVSATEAVQLADATLENLPIHPNLPPYEIWRQRLHEHFRGKLVQPVEV
jgi:hypothetical protein